ncbi:unnamed protein product [Oppiella nova]|uniref:Acyl-CoA dehydrogenase 6 n=1 Tax=Oppiella nova TaxID=334625 RepID=A0A7R9MK88_9ACAR|nr:unnamed protein product [Oppiella nova]CAG2177754.1 unnamed protein product [Oppiella nova]
MAFLNQIKSPLMHKVFGHALTTRSVLLTTHRSITFTAQHEELRKTVRKVIETHVNPYVDQWEEEEIFPSHQVFKKFGEAGLLGITRPPEYNGLGLDYSYSIAFFEELANINCGGIPTGITVQTDMAVPALTAFGSDYLKKEFLAPTVAGDYVACVGVSEPSGGSDVAALLTTARRQGDDLIINGSKMWISNGIQADWMSLLANTREGAPHRNKSLICLPLKTPGVKTEKINKMGLKCSDTAIVYFDDVRVPVKNIVGEEGQGFTYQMIQFQDERLCAATAAVAQMDRIVNETIEYCRQRKTFGSPLIDNQVIHFTLAELKTEIELLRSTVYRAADAFISGENVTYLASIAKLKAGRLSREVSDKCLQYYGGMGYTKEMLISRAFRDSRALSIAGGTDEIMLGIICKFLDILPKKRG